MAGRDVVHAWFSGKSADRVLERWWDLAELGLSQPPVAHELAPGRFHVSASAYPLLPLPLMERWLSSVETEQSDLAQLRAHAHDASILAHSYALHRHHALARGWPAHILALGRHVGVVYGMGRLHRANIMNVMSSASLMAGLVGGRKCAGRDWLKAVGLPVAPGALAATPDGAVALAEKLGWPIVLKRPIGGNGDGVMLSISDATQCREGAAKLLVGHPHVVVEKSLEGVELRVHVVCGKIWEIRRVTKRLIVGDGQSTAAELIARRHETFWRTVVQSEWMRERLVCTLWCIGVRTFGDLEAVKPAAGVQLRIASGVQTGPEGVAAPASLSKADRKQIEAAFKLLGSPSGGVDVMLSRPGAALAEGGAILELNIPCGMSYLSSPEDAAAAELRAWFRAEPDFRAAKGRVPLVIVGGSDPSLGRSQLCSRLRERFERVLAFNLSDESGWMPALMSDADAIVMGVTERTVMQHGLPLNSHPICYRSDPNKSAPTDILRATLANSGPVQDATSLDAVLRFLDRRRH